MLFISTFEWKLLSRVGICTTYKRASRERGVNWRVTLASRQWALLVSCIPRINAQRGKKLSPLSLWGSLLHTVAGAMDPIIAKVDPQNGQIPRYGRIPRQIDESPIVIQVNVCRTFCASEEHPAHKSVRLEKTNCAFQRLRFRPLSFYLSWLLEWSEAEDTKINLALESITQTRLSVVNHDIKIL